MMMKQFNRMKRRKKTKKKIQNTKPSMLKKGQYEKKVMLFQESMLNIKISSTNNICSIF
jgi:hypothetical protein